MSKIRELIEDKRHNISRKEYKIVNRQEILLEVSIEEEIYATEDGRGVKNTKQCRTNRQRKYRAIGLRKEK